MKPAHPTIPKRPKEPVEGLPPIAARSLLPYKWELIALFWCAYFFNQADRQVYSVVLAPLSAELHLSSEQAGLIGSIFMWTYAVLVPVAGYAGDVLRRKRIVFWSLLIWSSATICSGLSTGLVALAAFRGLATGGGEAFYYPAANSLIGQYHEKTRALAMAIHQSSAYVGIVASGLVAGWLADHFGWRTAFYVFGAGGVLLAFVILARIKDVPQPGGSVRIPLGELLRAVGRKPTVWALCIAFAGFNFAGWGYWNWMPTFLHEKYGLSLTWAGFSAMFYTNLFALAGVLIGGRLSDRWAVRRRTVRIEVEYAALFLGAPFFALMGLTDNLVVCVVAMSGFGLCRGFYDSNLFAVLFDVIEPRYRSSAVGAMLATAFLAAGFAPWLLGIAKGTIGLSHAFALLAVPFLASGLVLMVAAKLFFLRDYRAGDGTEP